MFILLVCVVLVAEPIWVSGRGGGYAYTLHHKSSFARAQVLYALPLSDPSSGLLRKAEKVSARGKVPSQVKGVERSGGLSVGEVPPGIASLRYPSENLLPCLSAFTANP